MSFQSSSQGDDQCFLIHAGYKSILFNIIHFLSSRMRSAPAEEQTDILGVYGSEVQLWNTEQRVEDWHVLLTALLNLCTLIKLSTPCQTGPSFRGTPSSTKTCQLCLTVFLIRTVQKFPLRDTDVIPWYKRACQSSSFTHHQPSVSVSVGREFNRRRPQATCLLLFSFLPLKCSNLVQAHLHLIVVFVQHLV